MRVKSCLPIFVAVLLAQAGIAATAETPLATLPDPVAPAVIGRPLDQIGPVRRPAARTATGNPWASKPVAGKPGTSKAVASKPVASEPVAGKPGTSKPVASKPVASEPVASKSVASKPVAGKPGASKPVASKPVPSKPVASKPAGAKPPAASGTATQQAQGKGTTSKQAAVGKRPAGVAAVPPRAVLGGPGLPPGAPPAAAQDGAPAQRQAKQAVDDRADPRMRLDDVGKGIHFARKPLGPGAYFDSKDRAAVRKYYAQHPGAGPGANWQIGQPVPPDAAVTPVPAPLRASLPKLPPGHRYVQVGGEVLLIAAESRMVVDGISRSP